MKTSRSLKRNIVTRRALICGAAAAIAAPSLSFAASAQGRRKVYLAGRQRMLTQRVAMAAYLAAAGIDEDYHLAIADEGRREFQASLNILRQGNGADIAEPESAPPVIAAIDETERTWAPLAGELDRFVTSGVLSKNDFVPLHKHNLEALSATEMLTDELVQKYGSIVDNANLAKAIKLASDLRLLSQKMSKEAAEVALHVFGGESRHELIASLEEFERKLNFLRHGDIYHHIPKPPADIAELLERTLANWLDVKDSLSAIALARRPDELDLLVVSDLHDPLLESCEAVVRRYAKV